MPKPGDFLTFPGDSSPVLVIRDDDGEVRAFHNVCRHRGTQLCRTETGHVRAIVCPYHSWTYSRQGDLIACQGMHDVDKSALGLRRLHAEVCVGLIYVSLSEAPPDFAPLRARFEAAARPQGFDRARSPKPPTTTWNPTGSWSGRITGNAHCVAGIRNTSRPTSTYMEQYASDAIRQKMPPVERNSRNGLRRHIDHARAGRVAPFPDPDHDLWFAADRTVLVEGFDTESMDGRRLRR
jgi:Rieske 2Fe-2S family protein